LVMNIPGFSASFYSAPTAAMPGRHGGPMEYLWRVLTYGLRPSAVATAPAV
jgi:hypothetical protein